jgi:hypothetical protein
LLDVQDDEGVIVDASGDRVCVDLLDRNVNMASCWLWLGIDLGSSAVERASVAWNDVTSGPASAPVREPNRCKAAGAAAALAPASTRPYRIETGGVDKAATLTKRGQKIAPLGDYAAAATSSSGRYVALRGHRDEGDAVHFLVVLADLDTGEITPLGKRAWPAAIDPKLLVGPRDRLTALAEDTVAETPLRWVSADALLVGQVLYFPAARRAVAVDGSLVR